MSSVWRNASCSNAVLVLALWLLLPAPAQPQSYPDKPIRIVISSVPGGGGDPSARRVAASLAASVGQQVIVENRSGGAGVIAAQEVARSAPDGTTLLYGLVSDILREFTPNAQFAWNRFVAVTRLWSQPYIVVVHPSVQADSLSKLIELAKAKPGALPSSSSGVGGGSSLFGALLKSVTGIDMVEVPYKSLGTGMPDLLSGRIHVAFETFPTVAPHIKSGKLKVLAVTQARRLGVLPDVPTVVESGLPGLETSLSSYILAPAGTPQPIVRQLQQQLARVVNAPDIKAQALANGQEIGGGIARGKRCAHARRIRPVGQAHQEHRAQDRIAARLVPCTHALDPPLTRIRKPPSQSDRRGSSPCLHSPDQGGPRRGSRP
ncbi:MAG TPA: tripartite tricarboxylate transporter substrate binding protein [Burkholderiaceae bacterium]|nr:tripartite tricarboxylate transporter substrate binding protein [Burkholderiaceae bacterium]